MYFGAHAFFAGMTGIDLLGVSEEEATYVASSLAKIMASGKRAQRKAKKVEKHSPWINLVLAIGAIYGPRAYMLWKMFQANKTSNGQGPVIVPDARREQAANDPLAVN